MEEQTVSFQPGVGGSPQRWHVLSMTFLAYLYDSLDLQILAICMPAIIAGLGISLTEGGLLASSTMLGTAVGGIIFGWYAENYGRKNAAVVSLFELGFFTLLVFWADSWGQLMILRFLQGLGIGGLWGPIVALIAEHWDVKYRARAAGCMLSTFAIGGILAGVLGRYLINTLGWRWVFVLTGTACLAAILFWFLVPADKVVKPEKSEKKDDVSLKELFAPGVTKLTIGATIAAACQMGGFWGVSSWVPTYLVQVRGLSLEYMSLFSIVIFSGAFVGYFFYAYLADRLGRRKALIIAFLMDSIMVPLYILIPNATLLFWIGPLMGLSFGGVFGLFGAYFAELFPSRIRAFGSGFAFNIGRGVGAMLTPYTVGVLAKSNGLGFGISACAVIFFLGVVTLFFMPETLAKRAD
ncbi:MAG: MFS transporter [Desulfovibrio sp.]|jgi:MFS family permease|nr:MFS transporter [Desulfovibrio sp.]